MRAGVAVVSVAQHQGKGHDVAVLVEVVLVKRIAVPFPYQDVNRLRQVARREEIDVLPHGLGIRFLKAAVEVLKLATVVVWSGQDAELAILNNQQVTTHGSGRLFQPPGVLLVDFRCTVLDFRRVVYKAV